MIVLAGSVEPVSSETTQPRYACTNNYLNICGFMALPSGALKRFTGAILLALTGIVTIVRIRQLLSKARRAS